MEMGFDLALKKNGLLDGIVFVDSLPDVVSCIELCKYLSRHLAECSSCRFNFCRGDVIGRNGRVPCLHLHHSSLDFDLAKAEKLSIFSFQHGWYRWYQVP